MLKTISLTFIFRGFAAVAGLLLSIIVARQLSAEEAGYYFLSFTTLSIVSSISLYGTNTISLRFIGVAYAEKDWATIHGVSISTLSVSFFISLIAIFLLLSFSPILSNTIWNKPAILPTLTNMALAVIFINLSKLVGTHLQAIHKTISSVVVLSINLPLAASALIFAFQVNEAHKAALVLLIATFINLVIGVLLWLYHTPYVSPRRPNYKKLFSSGLPLWVISILETTTLWGSQVIAGAWIDSKEIAYLAVAQRSAMIVSLVLIAINLVVAPKIAALYKQGKSEELHQLALRSVRLATITSLPCVLLLITFPDYIMSIFGKDFVAGSHLLVIVGVGQLINVLTGPVRFLLTMSGHEKDMRNVFLISSPIIILLALGLIPVYGATGAAIATAVGISLPNLGGVFMVRKRLKINTLNFFKIYKKNSV